MCLQPIIRVFNADPVYVHTPIIHNSDERGLVDCGVDASGTKVNPSCNSTLQVTNFSSLYCGKWVPIVYISSREVSNIPVSIFGFRTPWGQMGP